MEINTHLPLTFLWHHESVHSTAWIACYYMPQTQYEGQRFCVASKKETICNNYKDLDILWWI